MPFASAFLAAPTLRRTTAAIAIAFAATAPWSIALAQTAVVAGMLCVLIGVTTGRLSAPRLPMTLVCVFLFLFAQILSIPFGVHPGRSLQMLQGSWILVFPLLFWVLLSERSARRRALVVLVASAALGGAYGIVQHFVGIDWIRHEALENYGGGGYVSTGAFGGHLSYSGVLVPAFFVALGLTGEERRRWPFILAATAIGLGLLFSFSRTAWIGTAAGVFVLGALRGRRVFLVGVCTLVLIAAVSVLAEPAIRDRILSVLEIGNDPRSRLWRTALGIVADHPWLGAGLGSYPTLFPIYRVPGDYLSTIHPHSDILNHLVETGIVGAAAWVAIWVAFFLETRGHRSWLLNGMRAAVVAMLVAGLGQCYATDEEPAQIWWFVAMAALLHSRMLDVSADGSPPERGPRWRPWRALSRAFKAATLPLAARLFAREKRTRVEGRAATPAAEWERVLVVRQDNRLGNLLLLVPFLRRLREALPRAHIGFLSGEVYAPLGFGWPWVDQWIVQNKRRHAQIPPLFLPWIAGVRRARWDLAIEMSNHNTHSYYNCLLTLMSGAPERLGFDDPRSRPARTLAVPRPDETLHFSLAPLRLLRALGLPAAPAPMETKPLDPPSAAFASWACERQVDGRRLVAHLGGRTDKAWPIEAWEALLPALAELFAGPIVLVAGDKEQDRLDKVARALGPRLVAAPLLALNDLTHLLQGGSAFIGCDSGVMHLAVALGTPTVALFFRSNPYHYAPLGRAHRTVILADPYGVDADLWSQPPEGIPRSPLLIAQSEDREASLLGRPETGPRALAAITDAVSQVLAVGADTAGAPPEGDDAPMRMSRGEPT